MVFFPEGWQVIGVFSTNEPRETLLLVREKLGSDDALGRLQDIDGAVLIGKVAVHEVENGVDGHEPFLRLGSLNGGGVREGEGGLGFGDESAGATGNGTFDDVKVLEASEDVDLAEDSVGFAGVGYDGCDGDKFVVDERGEDGCDGAFNVADGVAVDVADFDGVGVVNVVGLTVEDDDGAAADGAMMVLHADDVGLDKAEQEFA